MKETARELIRRRDQETRARRRRRNRVALVVGAVVCIAANAALFIERDRVIGWVQERFGTVEIIIDR